MDVVLVAVKGVRDKVFGASNTNQGQTVALPMRRDGPLTIRAYLSQLSLSKLGPDASPALCLAPVRELLEDPEKGVAESWGLVERGFALAQHWDGGN
ncbi:hypothetical protein DL769_009204 [Monosporascus sp. CRB-8-3]|nr:hypothetical protein DL769_009204 [Monosporascus sp. CRB-8-3]